MQVSINPKIGQEMAAGVADYLEGLAGNEEAIKNNFPLTPADFRNGPLCWLCLGDGKVPARHTIFTNDKNEKQRQAVAYVDCLTVCPECMGKGEKNIVAG